MSLSDQYLFNQAKDSAHDYMMAAIRSIDEKFGDGFAAKNVSLINNFMLVASIDFLTCSAIKPAVEALQSMSEREDFSDAIYGIAESIDFIASGFNANVSNKPPVDGGVPYLTALTKERAFVALKDCWLRLHPQHTDKELRAAIVEFEKLVEL